jgi:hypothetical protein
MEFLYFILGTIFGYILFSLLTIYNLKKEKRKVIDDNTSFFNDVYKYLITNGSFISRVNNSVEILVNISGTPHTIVYILDRSEIAVFIGKECIKISSGDNVNRDIIEKIIFEINLRWSRPINSIVNINGSLIDSGTYKRITSNFNFDTDPIDHSNPTSEESLNLDDILDKIGAIGYENLSDKEKEFLNNIK